MTTDRLLYGTVAVALAAMVLTSHLLPFEVWTSMVGALFTASIIVVLVRESVR